MLSYHPAIYRNDDSPVMCRLKASVSQVQNMVSSVGVYFTLVDSSKAIVDDIATCAGVPVLDSFHTVIQRSAVRIRDILLLHPPIPVFLKCRVGVNADRTAIFFDVIYISFRQLVRRRAIRSRTQFRSIISDDGISSVYRRLASPCSQVSLGSLTSFGSVTPPPYHDYDIEPASPTRFFAMTPEPIPLPMWEEVPHEEFDCDLFVEEADLEAFDKLLG